MIVAFTAWENRISPVFDAARTLFVAQISDGKVLSSSFESFNPETGRHLTEMLKVLKIDVLICGAISEAPSNIIESGGVKLIPFIGGRIEEILERFINGYQISPDFLMPGCGRRNGLKSREGAFANNQGEVRSMPKGEQGQRGKCQGPGSGNGRGGSCQKPGAGKGSGKGRGGGTNQGKGQGGGVDN